MGGAAGHMMHPFQCPDVKTGNDLLALFEEAKNKVGSVKIDGTNVSFKLVDTPDGGKEFAGDRGSYDRMDVMGLTGVQATSAVGTIEISTNPVIDLVGFGLTSSVGALAPADVMGLTGLGATSSVGSISPADVMGLTGVAATVNVGNVSPLGYESITGDQSASYSSVTATQSANYTAVNADN